VAAAHLPGTPADRPVAARRKPAPPRTTPPTVATAPPSNNPLADRALGISSWLQTYLDGGTDLGGCQEMGLSSAQGGALRELQRQAAALRARGSLPSGWAEADGLALSGHRSPGGRRPGSTRDVAGAVGASRIRLPPASPPCCEKVSGGWSLTSTRISSASRRTKITLQGGAWVCL
jgi:hypothetical protein